MVTARDVEVGGRVLRVHDSGSGGDAPALVWHHGSPQTGALLEPVLAAAARRDLRVVSYGRPSCGGSTPSPGRDVASAAGDVAAVADALGLSRLAVVGASGGGPHALACAALLPDRVLGAVSLAGPAPFTADFPWYEGMADEGPLRAARRGRDARARYVEHDRFDESSFVDTDWAALAGRWAPLGEDVGRAAAEGPDGLVDDDVALAAPWGFDVARVGCPVLLVHGGRDRVVPPSHSDWLLRRCPRAELWVRPRDGHVAVLDALPVALDWLREVSGA
ncbi:alpha/beta fold hydrolase [uncultured Pseudokineococcus sp.]|uniref:alpha/beta fold hydrolase n=1 Tax=uncultured Pseudokineococcus sp. TaxID=1642928 RepID=UPI002616FD70|nr:alpha/beta hydrolase [uncultured Pseudokineococcus sp.]